MASINTLPNLPVTGKRLILRADCNVPIKNSVISDPSRLEALIPTLDYLVKNETKAIIIATHIGRPDPKNTNPALSTQHLIRWFSQNGYPVQFVPKGDRPGSQGLFLLENLRFFEGEQKQDRTFAQQLASYADVYINDAWGAMHRNDTSITLLAQQFDHAHRGIGLCVENELKHLARLKERPDQPFVVILGGAKLADKLPLITGLLSAPAAQRPAKIIVGGALCLPLLAAQDDIAKTVLKTAHDQKIPLILPTDFIYENDVPVDIGPESIKTFCREIASAQTIFMNGTMGKYECPDYAHGTEKILEAVAQNKGYTVIGGGDCAAAAHQYKLADKISWVSTGGGATLAYLAAKNPDSDLPGLRVLGI